MSNELSPIGSIDPLSARVLRDAQEIRDRGITKGARLAVLADERMLRENCTEALLADEVTRLNDRMEWLHKHPKLRRLIGRSAIDLSSKPAWSRGDINKLSTPIILDSDTVCVDEHVLNEGLVFWKYDDFDKTLHIDRAVEDKTTGHRQDEWLYSLLPYESDTGSRLYIRDGGAVDEYREQRRKEAHDKYADKEPWVNEYQILPHDLTNGSPHFKVEHLPGAAQRPYIDKQNQQDRIRNELVPEYFPGNGWEYPDELFYDPLRLVKLANDALGRTK